jgi:DNA-binding NarL/FixJ family response regulator
MGDVEPARQAADELIAVAGESQSPFLAGLAAAAEGSVLLAEGDLTDAIARLREAWAMFQHLGYPYEAARAQVAIGLATRAAGDSESAALELQAALATLDRLGAVPDAEHVRSLLHPHGQRVSRLTNREVDVLRLVAQGRTNREIGATLFVSEHTVARHLSNIFSKIGVTSRAAATAYAYENELV